MVANEEAPTAQSTSENTGTFGKLKQTLSSSLLTAQDRGEYLMKFFFSSERVLWEVKNHYNTLRKLCQTNFRKRHVEKFICCLGNQDAISIQIPSHRIQFAFKS